MHEVKVVIEVGEGGSEADVDNGASDDVTSTYLGLDSASKDRPPSVV